MDTKELERLISIIREETSLVLQQKTGWGRNDLKIQLEQVYSKALIRLLTSN
jgi:hypothetical protein